MARNESDPPVRHRGASWWERELEKKADLTAVDLKLEARDKSIHQAKSIAKEAKDKAERPHVCLHEEEFDNMKDSLNSLRNWKVGGLTGVIVLIVAAVANYVSLSGSVENTKDQVTEVKQVQKEMKAEVTTKIDSLRTKIDQTEKAQVQRDVRQQEDLKKILKDAVREARADIRPTRRHDTN